MVAKRPVKSLDVGGAGRVGGGGEAGDVHFLYAGLKQP